MRNTSVTSFNSEFLLEGCRSSPINQTVYPSVEHDVNPRDSSFSHIWKKKKSRKRKCCVRRIEDDRISSLPESVLHQMLSYLPLDTIVTTSVLSSYWQKLWTKVPVLKFICPASHESHYSRLPDMAGEEYCRWVNHVLEQHDCHVLDELQVVFLLDSRHQDYLNHWLDYAFTRKVEKIELDLLGWSNFCAAYNFSEMIVRENQRLRYGVGLGFGFLKCLSLKHLRIDSEYVNMLFANCALLEKIELIDISKLDRFEVMGACLFLKNVVIKDCLDMDFVAVCKCEKLVSLDTQTVEKLLLRDLPHLIDLSLSPCSGIPSIKSLDDVPNLLGQLESLSLWGVFFPEGLMNVSKFNQLIKLRTLLIEIKLYNDETFNEELISLLNCLPLLEVFKLVLFRDVEHCNFATIGKDPRGHTRLSLLKLNTFHFVCYQGSEGDVTFLRQVLLDCVNLKEVILNPCSHEAIEDGYGYYVSSDENVRYSVVQQIADLRKLCSSSFCLCSQHSLDSDFDHSSTFRILVF